jgi:hypothetical protein
MRQIKGYEGLYAVTSCGKVWSYRRKKWLKLIDAKDGYKKVNLYDKFGDMKTYQVHRLVAEAYIENPEHLPEVNHKSEVKDQNWLNNLEWCDKIYNCNYGTKNERAASKTRKPVYCVELDAVFEGIGVAARETNTRQDGISACLHGKQKTANGYHWEQVKGA